MTHLSIDRDYSFSFKSIYMARPTPLSCTVCHHTLWTLILKSSYTPHVIWCPYGHLYKHSDSITAPTPARPCRICGHPSYYIKDHPYYRSIARFCTSCGSIWAADLERIPVQNAS